VRRLDARALAVRRIGARRFLELRLVNRGNVIERVGRDGLRLSLLRDGRRFATLRPRSDELLPHSVGVVVFPYRGSVRGAVVARIELRPPVRGSRRAFHLRL
jgi:hypothetical protein